MREGLGVFVNAELRASLRRCCTVAHVQQLLCGVAEIDVEDWRSSAEYHGAPPPQGRGASARQGGADISRKILLTRVCVCRQA